MNPTPPVDLVHLAARLGLAVALGSIVGVNRELRQKPAGLRTHALVALGAALVTVVGTLMTGDSGTLGRLVQGLLAGIGFIGGGVILHRDDTQGVHGLTTAAAVWLVAGVGIAVGAGLWAAGVIAIGLTLVVLALGAPIDEHLRGPRQP
ncbi:MAG TPA: MgtC/SapB family protein [Vicinamibacterales bacterium]